MGKYFLDTARHAKVQEFLELKQGDNECDGVRGKIHGASPFY